MSDDGDGAGGEERTYFGLTIKALTLISSIVVGAGALVANIKNLLPLIPGLGSFVETYEAPACETYDGFYDGTRVYQNPAADRIASCKPPHANNDATYKFVAEIKQCKVTFDSDRRKWSGTIDANGHISMADFDPPPVHDLFVSGLLTNARVESGYCGPGTLKLEKRSP
ncbi:MAG: hypothetical protein AAF423_04445 [Pseudomonadota bacterium]